MVHRSDPSGRVPILRHSMQVYPTGLLMYPSEVKSGVMSILIGRLRDEAHVRLGCWCRRLITEGDMTDAAYRDPIDRQAMHDYSEWRCLPAPRRPPGV